MAATLTLTDNQEPAGNPIHLVGDGFRGGEEVIVYMLGLYAGVLPASQTGEIEGQVFVPRGAPAGSSNGGCAAYGTLSGELATAAFTEGT
jgi:hypothetical protein